MSIPHIHSAPFDESANLFPWQEFIAPLPPPQIYPLPSSPATASEFSPSPQAEPADTPSNTDTSSLPVATPLRPPSRTQPTSTGHKKQKTPQPLPIHLATEFFSPRAEIHAAALPPIPSLSSSAQSQPLAGAGATVPKKRKARPTIKKIERVAGHKIQWLQADFDKLYPEGSLIVFPDRNKRCAGIIQGSSFSWEKLKVDILDQNKKPRNIQFSSLIPPPFYPGDTCMVLHPQKNTYVVATCQTYENETTCTFTENSTQESFQFISDENPYRIPLLFRRIPLKRGAQFPKDRLSDVDRVLNTVATALGALDIPIDRTGL